MLSIRAVASGKSYLDYKKPDGQVKSFTLRELISLRLPWGQEGEVDSYLFVLNEDIEFNKGGKEDGWQNTKNYNLSLFISSFFSFSCILSSSFPFA